MCFKRRLFLVLMISALFMSGCRNNSVKEPKTNITLSAVYEEKESIADSVVIEEESNDMESIENDPDMTGDESSLAKYLDEVSALEHYQDYYFHKQYLIIEPSGITSYLCIDGYTSIKSIQYDDIVRISVDYIDNLGFLEITDKAGDTYSFIFESSIAKEAEHMINSCR